MRRRDFRNWEGDGAGGGGASIVITPKSGEPVTSTTSQLTPSKRSEFSKKEMSPEARAQLRAWLDATDAQEQAQLSGPPADTRTAGDIAAEVASQEQSQIAMDRAKVAAMPDPFAPPSDAPPAIEGKLPLTFQGKPIAPIVEAQPQAGVDRSFTSQEFAATPEMRGPQTLEAAKDEAAIYETQAKARIAKEQADGLAAQQADRARRQEESMARINAAADQYQKLSDKLFEEPSTFSRIMGAVAMGLGAYGAALTGGHNWAYEIIKTNQQHDLDTKKMRLQGALERMKRAGTSYEEIDKWAKTQEERLMAISKAQLGAIDTSVSRMLAPFPQAQREWQQKSATLAAENAAKIANFVQGATGETKGGGSSTAGVTQTVVEGRPVAPGSEPGGTVTEAESKKAQYSAEIIDAVKTIKSGRPLTDEEIRLLNRNVQKMRAQVEQSTKGISKPLWNQALQDAGILPETFYDGLSDDAKVTARAWLVGSGLIIRDQSGAAITNAEDFTSAQNRMVQPGEGPKAKAEKLRSMEMTASNMERLAGKNAYYRLHGEMPAWGGGGKAGASAKAPEPRTPPTKAEAQKKLLALPEDDRAWATKALMLKRDDPAFEKADKWLRARGIR